MELQITLSINQDRMAAPTCQMVKKEPQEKEERTDNEGKEAIKASVSGQCRIRDESQ